MWPLLGGGTTGAVDPSVLAQYGVVGLALLTVRILFVRLEKQYAERDAERERELVRTHDRADRLEAELGKVNAETRATMQTLTEATRAVSEAMTRMRGGR